MPEVEKVAERPWNTAPFVTCPACGHEFEEDHSAVAAIMRAAGAETVTICVCPECKAAIAPSEVKTTIEWQWRLLV